MRVRKCLQKESKTGGCSMFMLIVNSKVLFSILNLQSRVAILHVLFRFKKSSGALCFAPKVGACRKVKLA